MILSRNDGNRLKDRKKYRQSGGYKGAVLEARELNLPNLPL